MKTPVLFLYSIFVRLLPPTHCFALKRSLLRFAGVQVGRDVRCVSSASFFLSGALSLGDKTWIGHEVLIVGGDARISIGKHCDIAPRVTFTAGTHEISHGGPRVAGVGTSLPINVGDGCWICAGATILGGTTLGERCIVAAGAVVRGDFPPNSLIGGVPAKLIKSLV